MQIFVRTLDGKIITLNVESSDTIEEMEAHEKMFYGQQCLMHDLKSLAESHILAYYNIEKESTLVLVLSVHLSILFLGLVASLEAALSPSMYRKTGILPLQWTPIRLQEAENSGLAPTFLSHRKTNPFTCTVDATSTQRTYYTLLQNRP